MNEELQQAIQTGTLDEKTANELEALSPGAFCIHKSWGFGRISEWRLLTGQIIIDFTDKKGHPMQARYAVESLTVIPADHVRARVHANVDEIRALAKEDPVGLVREILANHGGKATADQIQELLVPGVFDVAGFRRWWTSAKKKLKSDGHFQLPAKKTEPVELLDAPVAAHAGLLTKFRSARHLKDQVLALDQLMKELDEFRDNAEELAALSAQIEDVAGKGRRLQAAHALELLLARDQIIAINEAVNAGPGAPLVADILRAERHDLAALFASLPAAKHRAVLTSFEAAFGDDWRQYALELLKQGSTRLVMEVYRLFEKKGLAAEFKEALEKSIADRSITSETLYWLCKDRGGPFPELFNPDLFSALISALEMDQLAETRRGTRLHDLLMDDAELLGDFLKDQDRQTVRDAMRRLMLTTVFDDLNRRSLMGRIIKRHPEMQGMVGGAAREEEGGALTVSWPSLERRKRELDDLVNRQIPQNVKDIATARSYGDLRENFEFKSAKEQQAVLSRRKAELERMLATARGTSFENPDTSAVSIGTVVTFEDATTGARESFSILGAWDSAPNRGIISYKAGVGQALLGKAMGDVAELPAESGPRKVRILAIEPFTQHDLLNEIAAANEPSPTIT